MLKKSKTYSGFILLESLVSLGVVVTLTGVILPLLVQLKWSESQMNKRWEYHRYVYETARDKYLLPELNQQKYKKNNDIYIVNIETDEPLISRLFIGGRETEGESVILLEVR